MNTLMRGRIKNSFTHLLRPLSCLPTILHPFVGENTMQKNTPNDHRCNFLPGLPLGKEWNPEEQTRMKFTGFTMK
jgi:hypothetical protein